MGLIQIADVSALAGVIGGIVGGGGIPAALALAKAVPSTFGGTLAGELGHRLYAHGERALQQRKQAKERQAEGQEQSAPPPAEALEEAPSPAPPVEEQQRPARFQRARTWLTGIGAAIGRFYEVALKSHGPGLFSMLTSFPIM